MEDSEQLALLHLLQDHYKKDEVRERLESLIRHLFRNDYGDIVVNAINKYYSNENIIVTGTLEEYNLIQCLYFTRLYEIIFESIIINGVDYVFSLIFYCVCAYFFFCPLPNYVVARFHSH